MVEIVVKEMLEEYIDACELINETMFDIQKLNERKKTAVIGKVKGSEAHFPYIEREFNVESIECSNKEDIEKLHQKRNVLQQRIKKAEEIKTEVEERMNEFPPRIQRIIRYKFFEKYTWEQTAKIIGRNCTGDSLRMELKNYLK